MYMLQASLKLNPHNDHPDKKIYGHTHGIHVLTNQQSPEYLVFHFSKIQNAQQRNINSEHYFSVLPLLLIMSKSC